MTQVLYSTKEAAEALGVETHALRYWEEELGLSIERSAQGRRVYSEEDMAAFRQIMEWKKQGMQLKVIKDLIHGEACAGKEETKGNDESDMGRRIIMYRPREVQSKEVLELKQGPDYEREDKARRLQELLKQFISESIRESNTELLELLKEGLLKELDYQFRLQEEREEEREKLRIEKEDEHFRQLDENIRSAMEKRSRKKKKTWGKL
jgi:DNA-binding transcriptional MerR regulator